MKEIIRNKVEELLSKEYYCNLKELNEKGDNILAPSDYQFDCLFEGDVLSLNGLTGFENSLTFDDNGSTPTEALARNIIPFYSASVTNIGSQMVASRCGYIPLWVDTFGTILDGSSIYNDIVSASGCGLIKTKIPKTVQSKL